MKNMADKSQITTYRYTCTLKCEFESVFFLIWSIRLVYYNLWDVRMYLNWSFISLDSGSAGIGSTRFIFIQHDLNYVLLNYETSSDIQFNLWNVSL